jgi:cytochrome c peroxidase
MMKKTAIICLAILGGYLLISEGCKKETISPDTPVVTFHVPQNWPAPHYNFSGNTLTGDGFALGRKLFYDVRLSRNNTISCGTCHQQFAGFANFDHATSHGINDLLGKRNSPPIFNLAWSQSFFWDGGVINIENQPINPIQNPVEMDMTLPDIITKISSDADYRQQFKTVFGDETINSQRIFKAICQFMGAIVSDNSRYDKFVRGEDGGTLSAQEQNGLALFRTKCSECHKEPLFTDYTFRNNGLMPTLWANDSGRAHITLDANDLYKFKVPSLRNLELTPPYMHDGRFKTIDEVLDHYRSHISTSPTLDPSLSGGIAMSDNEKQDIISFLKTLTDTTFTKDPRFADPNKF